MFQVLLLVSEGGPRENLIGGYKGPKTFVARRTLKSFLNAFNRLMSGTLLSSGGDQAWRQRNDTK